MTKSIVVVKMPCKNIISVTINQEYKVLSSWPFLISDVLVVYNFASDWPRPFFTARLFLFSISLLFVSACILCSV